LVLVHSTVCDRRMWDPQWPVLAEAGYRVVRGDFRGFGDTPAADRPYTDAGDVTDLMDALDIGRAALIGSSYGGRVVVEIAARWPDRVTAMALICAGLPGHEPSPELRTFWERETELLEAGDVSAAVDLNVATWLGPQASPHTREQVRAMQQRAFDLQLAASDEVEMPSAEVDLSAVRAPCLALSGGHDLPDFREIAASLPGLFPAARHVELPWAGHLPSLERPAEVTPLLVGFLAERYPPRR
jgi:3-oxoadipate enol-lactonase